MIKNLAPILRRRLYIASQASTAKVSLQGAVWEIMKETKQDGKTSLVTVYKSSLSPVSQSDTQRLDPGQVLTLQWDQKGSHGRPRRLSGRLPRR